jgi:hypothetical protein
MRKIWFAVLAAAACLAGPALAQTQPAAASSFAGTWGFQSDDYGNDDYGLAMSGVAVITQGQGSRYTVRLLVQDLLTERESGVTHLLVAHEDCSGDASNGQLAITCQLTAPLPNYQPDAFILQPGEGGDQLVGALSSAPDGQTTFNRMH